MVVITLQNAQRKPVEPVKDVESVNVQPDTKTAENGSENVKKATRRKKK